MIDITNITTKINLQNVQSLGNNQGKNSCVFCADDEQLGKKFIVKQITKESIYNDYQSKDKENLFSESKILYKVMHPNITEIQYASSDDNNIYMVMPYYERGSMQSILENRNLTAREVVKYSLEFLSGLMHVHANKLIHFDIKPTNILINNNGKATLTDFGLSRYQDANTETAVAVKLYTKHWPPEYLVSNVLSHQADIYQAGVTMYRMINGNDNWKEQLSKGVEKKDLKSGVFPDRKYYLPHVPTKLKRIINRCMDVDLNKRYDSILDIINALSNIEGNIDWRFKNESTKLTVWENTNGKMITRIELLKVGQNYNLKGLKTNIETGRVTNIKQLNNNDISLGNAHKIIRDFINP